MDRIQAILGRGRLGISIIGICRGAQMLNVLHGGSLYQHVDKHTGNHIAEDWNGNKFNVTSTHHQQMIPTKDGVVYATASESTVKKREGVNELITPKVNPDLDDEVVIYYPTKDTFAYCFQPHPEYDIDGDTEHLFWQGLYGLVDFSKYTDEVKQEGAC